MLGVSGVQQAERGATAGARHHRDGGTVDTPAAHQGELRPGCRRTGWRHRKVSVGGDGVVTDRQRLEDATPEHAQQIHLGDALRHQGSGATGRAIARLATEERNAASITTIHPNVREANIEGSRATRWAPARPTASRVPVCRVGGEPVVCRAR